MENTTMALKLFPVKGTPISLAKAGYMAPSDFKKQEMQFFPVAQRGGDSEILVSSKSIYSSIPWPFILERQGHVHIWPLEGHMYDSRVFSRSGSFIHRMAMTYTQDSQLLYLSDKLWALGITRLIPHASH